jgi:hypothetical protein
LKKKTPELPILSIEDLADVLQGKGRHIERLKHMYTDAGLNGTHVHICNYKLETSVEGHLTLPSSVNQINLTLENCEFNSLEVVLPYAELCIIDCALKEFQARQCTIQKLTIKRNRHVIESLTINDSMVDKLDSDANFHDLSYVGQISTKSCIAELSGNINTLVIKDIADIRIFGTPVITKCKVLNSCYPFQQKKVSIGELIIIKLTSSYLDLSGLFGSVSLSNFNGNINLTDFTCLSDCLIEGSRSENHNICMSNTYIGGKLLLSGCSANMYAANVDGGSEYLYLDQLVFKNSMKDLFIKNINVAPVHINFLSFINILVGKDQQWTLQGLKIINLSFEDFRNAGTGNIISLVGGTFNHLKESFEELTRLAVKNELDGSFFRAECNIIDAAPLHGTLNLYSSDLGKLNFIDSDFSNFRLNYYSTKLNEIFLAGSSLPRKVDAMGPGSGDARVQVKIANMQLKKLHEQHGDLIAANEYFANENEFLFCYPQLEMPFLGEIPFAAQQNI